MTGLLLVAIWSEYTSPPLIEHLHVTELMRRTNDSFFRTTRAMQSFLNPIRLNSTDDNSVGVNAFVR